MNFDPFIIPFSVFYYSTPDIYEGDQSVVFEHINFCKTRDEFHLREINELVI